MKISDESAYNDKTTVELKEILEQKKQEMMKSQEKMGGKDAERMTEMAKLTRYYGDKVQTLITEMQKDNPIDENTEEYTSIKKIIESFKLDKELIKWDDNEEDFKPFD